MWHGGYHHQHPHHPPPPPFSHDNARVSGPTYYSRHYPLSSAVDGYGGGA